MTKCNSLNVKLPDLQLNELKSGRKNDTMVTSSSVIGDFNDGTNLLHNLLLTDTQVLILCEAFPNN